MINLKFSLFYLIIFKKLFVLNKIHATKIKKANENGKKTFHPKRIN